MRAQVKPHKGTPTLFLDGEPAYANFNLLGPFEGQYREPSLPVAHKFGKLGIDLYSIDAVFGEWCGPRPDNPSHYDFSLVGPRLQAILDQNPNAHFLLRMGFETRWSPNNWWNQMHPDELEVLGGETEGLADLEYFRQNKILDARRPSQSYASKVWRQQVNDLLRAYIQHLRDIGMYDRVIAYQIAAGSSGEWVKDVSDMGNLCGDYSEPMRQRFRAWLRRKYGNYLFQLTKAWDDNEVTFDTAEVPSPKAQFNTRHGLFRDPAREQNVVDYYTCLAELCAEVLGDFCKTVKEATNGEKLAGAFYGYLMELSWSMNFFGYSYDGGDFGPIQRCGHLGLSQLLRSPHIDFLVSPYSYPFRGLGGEGLAMQPSESVRLHGKIYLMEEDTLMHNRFEEDGRMHPVENTLAIYKRNFANSLMHGHGMTWIQSSYHAEYPQIEREADALHAHMQNVGTWAMQLDRSPQAEIAVLLDEESYFYATLQNNISLPGVFYQRVINLPRIGAPHDVYLLRDLVEGKLPPYKLYIFLNAFRLTRQQRQALAKQLRRDKRTALWLYAPGYIYDDASTSAIPPPSDGPATPLHTDNMTELTGIRFGKGENPWALHMHITNFQHEITRDIPQDLFWGTQRMLGPLFHVEDVKDAEGHNTIELGQVIYSLGRCKPGMVVKEFADWNSVYVATPNVPSPVLRGIARFAGVHLYNTAGDVLGATRNLLSVHTVGGGPRTFKLPQPAEVVYDLFNQREVARNANTFQVVLPPASTTLWYTGDEQTLKQFVRDDIPRRDVVPDNQLG